MDLLDLKRRYRTIFCTEIAGERVFWRPLTWQEHEAYIKIIAFDLVPIGKLQDTMFREIVLSPSSIDEMNLKPPGFVASIVNAAVSVSGNSLTNRQDVERLNTDLATARENLKTNPFDQMIMVICRAFPTYSPFDLRSLEFIEIIRLLVMAENILGMEQPITFGPPEGKRFTDKIFEDAAKAQKVDEVPPPGSAGPNIKDELRQRYREDNDMSWKQARQMEMMRRMREKSRS